MTFLRQLVAEVESVSSSCLDWRDLDYEMNMREVSIGQTNVISVNDFL